jgi:hypothetical protein
MEGHRYLDAEHELVYYEGPYGCSGPDHKTKTLYSNDSPKGFAPLTSDAGGSVDPGDDIIDELHFLYQFDTFVVAQTTDTRDQGNEVYTPRARIEWEFGGECAVQQEAPYYWVTPNTVHVTPPSNWTDVTDDAQLFTDPPLANEVVNTWSTVN